MDFELNDNEVKDIDDLCKALEPFEVAVKALCRRDSNLLKADKTIQWTIQALEKNDNSISKMLLAVS